MRYSTKIIMAVCCATAFLAAAFVFSFTTSKTVEVVGTVEILAQQTEEGAEDLIGKEQKGVSDVLAEGNKSPFSGVACPNYDRRAFAVMLSGDRETRPLSGIAQADMVFEMPVITGSITRYMAVFQCESPDAIGSVRSARHDFIPLAAGLDAVFVHWGGSHFALDRLHDKIVDNLDAIRNPYNTFYRDPNAPPAPHNGFTSAQRMLNASQKLGYRAENEFTGYPFYTEEEIKNQRKEFNEKQLCGQSPQGCAVTLGYPSSFRVVYEYDREKNYYRRKRGGVPEIDKNTKTGVRASNVVVMVAASRQIEGQYNDVELEGAGQVFVFQNGRKLEGTWKKDKEDIRSALLFFDAGGNEIPFTPGQTWVEIIERVSDLKSDFK